MCLAALCCGWRSRWCRSWVHGLTAAAACLPAHLAGRVAVVSWKEQGRAAGQEGKRARGQEGKRPAKRSSSGLALLTAVDLLTCNSQRGVQSPYKRCNAGEHPCTLVCARRPDGRCCCGAPALWAAPACTSLLPKAVGAAGEPRILAVMSHRGFKLRRAVGCPLESRPCSLLHLGLRRMGTRAIQSNPILFVCRSKPDFHAIIFTRTRHVSAFC